MDDNIKNLVNYNRILLADLDRTVHDFRSQNFDKALRRSTKLIDYFNTLLNMVQANLEFLREKEIKFDQPMLLEILQELFQAQNQKDYVLLSDLYEIRLTPMIYQFQESLLGCLDIGYDHYLYLKNIGIIEQMDSTLAKLVDTKGFLDSLCKNGLYIEPTSTGDMTIAIGEEDIKHYLHSNINVWKEAAALARSWYDMDKSSYIIYGFGLGYHIQELLQIDEYLDVEVYESDLHVIQSACAYTDNIKIFSNPQVKLFYDPDFTKLSNRLEHMDNDTEFVIHYPSLQVLPISPIKEKLENYFIQYSSVKNQLPLLNGNFNRNIQKYDGFVDNLKSKFQDKSLYIVAAGPSLDLNFLQLKDIGEESIILATGTVFKKLIKAGIKPDYVLVTDPNSRVYKQISGMENCDVPMLFLSTAYHGFASNYQGKKYMVCQKDYPKAEEFARQNGLHCIRTGGSVSTTALDIGITFGCSRIIFLGLDLAYTDNFAHASDTSRRNATDFDNLRQVEDIHGNMVPTNRSLDMFRTWIENRIKDEEGIEFIDATEGGAKIRGMRIVKLADVIHTKE